MSRPILKTIPLASAERMPSLDIFRGICAITVVFYHILAHLSVRYFLPEGGWLMTGYNLAWRIMQPMSEFAVLGFFVLSGVVITIYILRDIAPQGRYLEFLVFRFTRIASVCVPVTLVSLALAYLYQTMHPGQEWPRYQNYSVELILASATGFGREWNWPGWTLDVEWTFYLLLTFVLAFTRPKPINIAIALGCGLYLITRDVTVTYQAYLVSFFMGIALVPILGLARQSARLLMGISLILIAAIVAHPVYAHGYDHSLMKSIPLAMLVLAFADMPRFGGRLHGVLLHLGRISFSLYLWHWPVILFGNYYLFDSGEGCSYFQAAIMFIVYPIVTFILAHYSYFYLERHYKLPFLKRFFARRGKEPMPGPMGGTM